MVHLLFQGQNHAFAGIVEGVDGGGVAQAGKPVAIDVAANGAAADMAGVAGVAVAAEGVVKKHVLAVGDRFGQGRGGPDGRGGQQQGGAEGRGGQQAE